MMTVNTGVAFNYESELSIYCSFCLDEDPDENEIENGNAHELAKMLIDMACRYRGQADKLTADHEKVHSAHIMQRRAILTWRARYDAEVQRRKAADEHVEVLEAAIREAGGEPAKREEKEEQERPFTDEELDAKAREADETDREQAYEKIRDQSEEIRRLKIKLRMEQAETASHGVQCEVRADTGSEETQTEVWEPDQYQCEINTLNAEVGQLRAEVEACRESLQEYERLQITHQQQSEQLTTATDSLEIQTTQVTEKEREIRRLNNQNRQLQEQYDSQSENLVDLKIKLSRDQVQEEFGVMVEMPPERWQALLNTCVNELQSYKKQKADMRARILELEKQTGEEGKPQLTQMDKKPLSAELSEQCKEGAERIAQLEEELLLAYTTITKLETKRDEVATKYQEVMTRCQELQSSLDPKIKELSEKKATEDVGDGSDENKGKVEKDAEQTETDAVAEPVDKPSEAEVNSQQEDKMEPTGDNNERINQLQAELEDLRGVTDELRQAAAAQTESNEELSTRLRDAQQALEEQQGEVTRLRGELETMTEERNSFKSQFKDERDKTSALSIVLVGMKADTVAQANKLQTIAGELAASRLDKREELMFQINRLNNQLDESRKKLTKESEKVEKLESELSQKSEEVTTQQQRIEELSTEQTTLNNRVGFLEAQVNDMTEENSSLLSQKSELESEKNDLVTRVQDLDMLHKTDSSQQEELGAFAESLRKETKEANERALQSEAEAKTLSTKLKQVEEEHNKTREEFDAVQSEFAKLQESMQKNNTECEELSKELIDYKQKHDEYQTLLSSREEEANKMSTEMQAMTKEVENLRQQLDGSADLCKAKIQEVENLQGEIDVRETEIAEHLASAELKENETRLLSEQIDTLRSESESQMGTSSSLHDELKEINNQLTADLEALKSENAEQLATFQRELIAQAEKIKIQATQSEELQAEVDRLTSQSENHVQALENMSGQSETEKAEITRLLSQSEDYVQDIEKLSSQSETQKAEITRLIDQSETQQSEIDRLSTQNTELQRDIENTRREVMESSMTSQSSAVSEVSHALCIAIH